MQGRAELYLKIFRARFFCSLREKEDKKREKERQGRFSVTLLESRRGLRTKRLNDERREEKKRIVEGDVGWGGVSTGRDFPSEFSLLSSDAETE